MKPTHSLIRRASVALIALLAASGLKAYAGPPEDDVARRIEQAAERAQKAAERAADAAQRAAEATQRSTERAARDASERAGREREAQLREEREADKISSDRAREAGREQDKLLEAAKESEIETSGAIELASGSGTSGSGTSGSGTSGSGDSSGGSGSTSTSGDGSSNSGSGSSNSGSGSYESGDDDGDGGDDQEGVLQAGRGDGFEKDELGNPYRSNELVILADDAAIVDRARGLGFVILETSRLEAVGSVLLRVQRPADKTSAESLALLRAEEPRAASGYNYVYDLSGPPAGKPAPQPKAASASQARASARAVVGVLDGFQADSVGGWKVERLAASPAQIAHGDAVATILLDDLRSYGASLKQLLLVDIVSKNRQADVAALILGLDRLVTQRASYVNISLAGPDHPGLKLAVARSLQSGLTIVAAVGNAGPAAPPAFPAAYEGVIGVTAVDAMGRPYIYSARGDQVDVAAPGVEEMIAGDPNPLSGTSYAAPHVTAFLAARRPEKDGLGAERVLLASARDAGAPGRDAVYGLGILDPTRTPSSPTDARLAAVIVSPPH